MPSATQPPPALRLVPSPLPAARSSRPQAELESANYELADANAELADALARDEAQLDEIAAFAEDQVRGFPRTPLFPGFSAEFPQARVHKGPFR